MFGVHRAAEGSALATGLAEVLRTPPDDPFARDVVAVPAKGVERWLAQRLPHVLGSHDTSDGVCANVRFPSVTRLVDESLEAVAPADAIAAWSPDLGGDVCMTGDHDTDAALVDDRSPAGTDPRRRVDDDQRRGVAPARSSSRAPSHPLPSAANASCRVRGSTRSRRSAKSTASCFVRRP